MMNQSNISSNIARQILMEAKENGVSVEDYLKEVAKEKTNNGNGNLPKVRRMKKTPDFSKQQKWLDENQAKYVGKWIVLDGGRLVGAGDDPSPFVEQAREEGVEIPFVYFVEDDSISFTGGWI